MTIPSTIWGTEDVVRFPGVSVDRDAVTMLPNGGYVVTWREGTTKIGFQLYNGLGQKVGGANFLPSGAGGAQQSASVLAYGGDGDFVVTWTENSTLGKSFFSQKYFFDGSLNGAPTALVDAANSQVSTEMSSNNQGSWATAYIESGVVKVVQHDAAGVPTTPVTVFTGASTTPDIAHLGGTRHVVSYVANGGEVRFRVVDGTTVGSEMTILNAGSGDIIALKDANGVPTGDFVVIADKGVSGGIHAQRYTTNGTTITSAGSLEISGLAKPSSNDLVNATALKGGGYAVAYIAADGGDFGDVFVKVVDASGAPGAAIKINSRATVDGPGSQHTLSISEMMDGRLAVTWQDPTIGTSMISTTIVDARTGGVTVATGTSHADIYVGTEWADTLNGNGGDDQLFAGAGNDALDGGANNDSLFGQGGADTLNGDAGNDTLLGGAGADALDGGADVDIASYQDATAGVTINLLDGSLNAGDAQGDTYVNIEGFLGSNYNDHFTGDDNANTFNGAGGSDTVSYASHAPGITIDLAGGIGPDGDVLVSIENAVGTAGADTLIGNGDVNVLIGGAGNDTYVVQNTSDSVAEAADGGVDTIGTSVTYTLPAFVENLMATGSLAVTLTGNDLANSITGNGADNVINGGGGADVMSGGAGNDIYYVDNIGDVINDTSGVDTVVLAAGVSLANFTGIENVMVASSGAFSLDGSELGNTLTGNDAANVLNGLGGDDILLGLGGNDQLLGGTGNDLLKGGDGIDLLKGEAGNDTIYGGAAKDTLYGGSGKDIFAFDTRLNKRTNVDKIADFVVRDDSIYLDNAIFKKLGKGTEASPRKLNKAFFKVGEKAADKNDYLVYSKSKGVLYYDIDGSGSKAMVAIATLKKGLKVAAPDFFVI